MQKYTIHQAQLSPKTRNQVHKIIQLLFSQKKKNDKNKTKEQKTIQQAWVISTGSEKKKNAAFRPSIKVGIIIIDVNVNFKPSQKGKIK
jgi:hypothetical protein